MEKMLRLHSPNCVSSHHLTDWKAGAVIRKRGGQRERGEECTKVVGRGHPLGLSVTRLIANASLVSCQRKYVAFNQSAQAPHGQHSRVAQKNVGLGTCTCYL